MSRLAMIAQAFYLLPVTWREKMGISWFEPESAVLPCIAPATKIATIQTALSGRYCRRDAVPMNSSRLVREWVDCWSSILKLYFMLHSETTNPFRMGSYP
jgi:hypothetical protein